MQICVVTTSCYRSSISAALTASPPPSTSENVFPSSPVFDVFFFEHLSYSPGERKRERERERGGDEDDEKLDGERGATPLFLHGHRLTGGKRREKEGENTEICGRESMKMSW